MDRNSEDCADFGFTQLLMMVHGKFNSTTVYVSF